MITQEKRMQQKIKMLQEDVRYYHKLFCTAMVGLVTTVIGSGILICLLLCCK